MIIRKPSKIEIKREDDAEDYELYKKKIIRQKMMNTQFGEFSRDHFTPQNLKGRVSRLLPDYTQSSKIFG